jgi:hypothetical protein
VPARASVQIHRSAPSPAEKERALTQIFKSQYIYHVKKKNKKKKKSLLNSKLRRKGTRPDEHNFQKSKP